MLIQQQRAAFDLKDPFQSYVPVFWQTMIHSFPTHDSCRARYLAVKSLGFRIYPWKSGTQQHSPSGTRKHSGKF